MPSNNFFFFQSIHLYMYEKELEFTLIFRVTFFSQILFLVKILKTLYFIILYYTTLYITVLN